MLYQLENVVRTRQREKGYRLLISSLSVPQKAKVALTGPSGCGKSTTLDLLGLSLSPDAAQRFLFSPLQDAINIPDLWAEEKLDALADLRMAHLGYVLQSGELLPFLSTGENMMLTARLSGLPAAEAEESARELAQRLDIEHLWQASPQTLSVGERQRAAIARALAPRPQVILADEPTAALDPIHADKVMDVFLDCIERFGSALVLVTHNAEWARAGGFAMISFDLVEHDSGVTAIVDDRKTQ